MAKAFVSTSIARLRFGSIVAIPVGQFPLWQVLAWIQPVANINGRAIFTQSAPKAQILAISNADTILPDAPILFDPAN